jgi:hypothetical protein
MNSIAVITWKKPESNETNPGKKRENKGNKKVGIKTGKKTEKTTNNKITKIGWRSLFWWGVTILIRGLAIFIFDVFFKRCEH